MPAYDDTKPEPVTDLGIVVNFADRTVSLTGYTVPIEKIDSSTVTFGGRETPSYLGTKLGPITVYGSIDRVTGATNVWFADEKKSKNDHTFELLCRPTKRLF
jgi:hypothetical protein